MAPLRHRTIAFRLQCTGLLALAGVLVLAGVSVHFADRTQGAAAALTADGLRGSALATRMEMLLLQHRSLVESAPAQLDRDRLAVTRHRFEELNARLAAQTAPTDGSEATPEALRALADEFARELPRLVAAGDKVLTLAFNFVQDGALAASEGPYAQVADQLQGRIQAWRQDRLAILDTQAELLSSSAASLISRVLACAGLVLVLGAVVAAITRRVFRRLERIKDAMLCLAAHDTSVVLPSLDRQDELGAVARAVQTFKENAIRVGAQEAALVQAARQLEAALSNMVQGLCLYDPQNRLQVVNGRFCEIYGLDPALVRPGLTFHQVIELRIAAGNHPGRTADELVAYRLQRDGRSDVTLQDIVGGRVVTITERGLPDGSWVATYEDITARREAEERVAFLALHDPLTGLPNRVSLNDRMHQAVADASRGAASAVLCLDLDRFKPVNDTLGHPVGDRLLAAVAGRLRALVRDGDMVGRLGGDEFAIIQCGIDRPEEAKTLAEQVVQAIAAPFEIDGHIIVVGTTVGIALVPGDGRDPDRLMRSADMALYRAKADGRGTFCFFEPGMDARLQNRRQIENDLRLALARGEFELFYQPVVTAASNRISGFEALLRWRHPVRGLVSPAEFVGIMEEIGLIGVVGEWVLRTACAEAAGWPGAVKVAVNLSPVQFRSQTLHHTVRDALAGSGLAPGRLELEITESVLLQDTETTVLALHALRDLGVRIAMDDFGTGYSSLSYLRRFPFDRIKIDQSFVRDLSTREDSIHVIRAVTGLCQGLGMETTAEGVETPEQLMKLRREGCTELQGYLFSRPRPAAEVPGMIAAASAGSLVPHCPPNCPPSRPPRLRPCRPPWPGGSRFRSPRSDRMRVFVVTTTVTMCAPQQSQDAPNGHPHRQDRPRHRRRTRHRRRHCPPPRA